MLEGATKRQAKKKEIRATVVTEWICASTSYVEGLREIENPKSSDGLKVGVKLILH